MTHTLSTLIGLAALGLAVPLAPPLLGQPAPPRAAEGPPSLVVMIVVDQMRADYLEQYSGGFTGGLRRLMQEGAWFDRAAYPYLNTVTCPGHSTIGTGAFPYRHGMVLNTWWNRETQKAMDCTDDPATKEVSYGTLTGMGDSGHFQASDTLALQMRDGTHARTVTMSIKARSAIGLAGRRADAVTWFDERGVWTTSTAYTERPVPWLQRFTEEHPITADIGKRWERSLDPSAYKYEDARAGERPPTGWTNAFPHVLGVPGAKTNAAFYIHWLRSPYADEYLERMAEAAVEAMRLGSGKTTDYLGVSFSALDSAGHNFGPESHEVQDILVRLDRTLGRLLDYLDTAVGRGRYVLALSADHGVGRIPEQNKGAGRITSAQFGAMINAALKPIFGPGKYMAYGGYTDLYLQPGVYERVRRTPGAAESLREHLRAVPGVDRVFLRDEISTAAARRDADPVRRAAALSYYPGRSGDLLIVPRENWILSTAAATHGTLYSYDQRVPVIFFGPRVAAGRHSGPATPADIAPTLAALARVPFRQADGHVLADAISSATSTK